MKEAKETSSLRKSPQRKKNDEYDKDHRTCMEHPHAFRKNWPKKKASANRKIRAAELRLVASIVPEELASEQVKRVVYRHTIHKDSVMPLKQFVSEKRRRSSGS